ncbi:MAG: PilZ domain-containing protein [Candidatus Omnitrophica bacterium]|nr:PilZ domain-containing protein [Candidatus Omnitrophota bacterium]
MWDGFNKRKFPRINLRCELILGNRPKEETLHLQTENVGAGGLCVIIDQPLERFSTVSVRLELNPNLPWIECSAKVIWSVPSRESAGKKECFDTGLEFVDLEPGYQDLVRRYVEARAQQEESLH